MILVAYPNRDQLTELDFDYWVAPGPTSSTTSTTGLIAGLVVGLGCVFIILIAAFFIYRYKQQNKNNNEVISYKPTDAESKSVIELTTNNIYGGDNE